MKNIIIVIIASIFFTLSTYAQPNQVEVIAKSNCNQLTDNVYTVDIFVKALNANETVTINEQNYRFDYNAAALTNPSIVTTTEGLGFNNPVFSDNGNISFFEIPTLTGSLGNLVSFNIEMSGGAGLPLTNTEETYIGSIAFEVINPSLAYNFNWHHFVGSEDNWPPTYIGIQNSTERAGGILNLSIAECMPCAKVIPHLSDLNIECGDTDGATIVLAVGDPNNIIVESKPLLHWMDNYTQFYFNEENGYYYFEQLPAFEFNLKDGNCGTSFDITITSSACKLGANANQTNVYPNPANQQVTIDLNGEEFETGSVTIFDLAGKGAQVYSLSANQNVARLNTGDLANGIYLIKIKTDSKEMHTQKLTIAH